MPQLVKGGKWVFGWSPVESGGCIRIPDEAMTEYGFLPDEKVFVFNASKTSGGFIITRIPVILASEMSSLVTSFPGLSDFSTAEGVPVPVKTRKIGWTTIDKDGCFRLPPDTLAIYGAAEGTRLLAARGSYVGLSMLVNGPIIDEARKHTDIPVYRF